jgi:hypothetical protein
MCNEVKFFLSAAVLIMATLGSRGVSLAGETSGVSMSSGAAGAPAGAGAVRHPAPAHHRLAGGCEFESQLHSKEASISTYVNFVNRRDDVIRAYWINYQGERVFYAQLDPDRSYRQQTFVSHPWVITDRNNRCLSIYFPRANETSKVVY